jgi:hypothetical protein
MADLGLFPGVSTATTTLAVKYRLVDDPDPNHREPGWNIFSKETISSLLNKNLGEGRHSYTHFEMPFDIEANPFDPVRSWTFKDYNERR